ncbi:MAG: hypothetical protein QOE70_2424 [Chthoniobacter sp.]|jgi:putative membrane-bound dehydrogenase-like protein|nr:hypothetical protein [Chthoniobacter sp.]
MRKFLFAALLSAAAAFAGPDDFPAPTNSEPGNPSPMSPQEALAKITLPPGFHATLFAAEPEVMNPIAMSFDARGRLWIAENFTYAERALRFDLRLRDRILIFEDTDGDGRADSRKVFSDHLQMLTSIARGHGGVWALCPPQVLFIPDRNGDDVPDGPPEVVLDGLTVAQENYHNFANGLKWGPDGWLYGRCGASCPGELGVPGTPPERRVPIRGGLWRFHPERKTVEVLTHGTTNPWGHDWDAFGEPFFINTVNGHLWHAIPGAHFVRPHTIDPNPHAYGLIDLHADHWHFDTGQSWMASRDGKADAFGGGHAHVGMMIYLGDNWPADYRGKLCTLNFHGRRINVDRLERSGSGFVGKHEPDMVQFGDPWFRGNELDYGPDGGVFVLDWSDTGECHDSTGVHRTSGRIFKITYGETHPVQVSDLAKANPEDLVKLHTHENEWFARQARLELARRAAAGEDLTEARQGLAALLGRESDPTYRMRALFTLHAMGGLPPEMLRRLLLDGDEHLRAGAIHLLTDAWPLDTILRPHPGAVREVPPEILASFTRMAREDRSGLVRLALASTLQRLPVARRAELAAPLLAHAEDADDHNLPMLVWYGLMPLADLDPAALVPLAGACEWPTTRRYIARRVAEDAEKAPATLNALLQLAGERPEAFLADVLAGMSDAFTGWRKAPKPAAWDALQTKAAASADAALRDRVRDLSVLFGDGRALDEMKRLALDPKADLRARKQALQTLVVAREPDLRSICEGLLGEKYLNTVAIRGLAEERDPALGPKLVKVYKSFAFDERPQLLAVLVSRAPWAKALLDAVAEGKVPRADLSAFHAREIRNLGDPALTQQLSQVWGELHESAADKRQLMAKLKAELTPELLAKADPSKGRATFTQTCAVCHTLYGEGGKIGPDLTGSGRDNLDYLLENIIDPSAVVTADFRLSTLTLKDGRVLSGMIAARSERTLTLKTMTEALTIEQAEIASTQDSPVSLMPEGLLLAFTPEQVRDLFAYLMSRQQVPLAH